MFLHHLRKQHLAVSAIVLLYIADIAAQAGPDTFRTTFFVEDAIGNVDSAEIVIHPDGTTGFDTHLGEVLGAPVWDTVLDARLGSITGTQGYAKTFVMFGENSSGLACLNQASPELFIYAKHQPVTVTWNRDHFRTRCQRSSYITNNTAFQLVFPNDFFDDPSANGVNYSWTCLALDSQYVINTSEALTDPWIAVDNWTIPLANGQDAVIAPLAIGLKEVVVSGPCDGAYTVVGIPEASTIEGVKLSQVLGQPLAHIAGLPSGSYTVVWLDILGRRQTEQTVRIASGDDALLLQIPAEFHSGGAVLSLRDADGRIVSGLLQRSQF